MSETRWKTRSIEFDLIEGFPGLLCEFFPELSFSPGLIGPFCLGKGVDEFEFIDWEAYIGEVEGL